MFEENSGKSVLKRGKLSDDAEYRIHNIEHRIQNQNTVCTKEGGGESSLMMQLKASSPPLHHALLFVSPMRASYMVLTVHPIHGTHQCVHHTCISTWYRPHKDVTYSIVPKNVVKFTALQKHPLRHQLIMHLTTLSCTRPRVFKCTPSSLFGTIQGHPKS